MMIDAVSAITKMFVLSSQDVAQTNNIGAAMTQGRVYVGAGGMQVCPYAAAPADGETFASLQAAEVAKLAKDDSTAMAANIPLYVDFANNEFTAKPALVLPESATFNFATTGKTLVFSINGGAADTCTVETGDVVSLAAVTAAELVALLNTDIAGVVASSITGADGETYVVVTADAAGGSIALTAGTGLAVVGAYIGMQAVPCAKTLEAATAEDTTVKASYDARGMVAN